MPALKKTKHSFGKQAKGFNYNLVKSFANKMRLNPTKAEAAFHTWLKQSYIGPIKTQHHFVGRYNAFILDFYLPDKGIAFEIDGWHHYNDQNQLKKDKFRDNYCKTHGIKIIRLKNHEAMDKHIAQPIILKAIGASLELIDLASQPMPTVKLRKRAQ